MVLLSSTSRKSAKPTRGRSACLPGSQPRSALWQGVRLGSRYRSNANGRRSPTSPEKRYDLVEGDREVEPGLLSLRDRQEGLVPRLPLPILPLTTVSSSERVHHASSNRPIPLPGAHPPLAVVGCGQFDGPPTCSSLHDVGEQQASGADVDKRVDGPATLRTPLAASRGRAHP